MIKLEKFEKTGRIDKPIKCKQIYIISRYRIFAVRCEIFAFVTHASLLWPMFCDCGEARLFPFSLLAKRVILLEILSIR